MLAKVGKPPKVDLCILRVRPGVTDKTLAVDLRCKNQKGVKFDVPVSKADKYMCIHPEQFTDAFVYVGKLIEALKIDTIK